MTKYYAALSGQIKQDSIQAIAITSHYMLPMITQMKRSNKALCTLMLIYLGACSTTPNPKNNWPPELPALTYFQDYYAKDPEHQKIAPQERYLLWVKRFYLGWELYQHGWLQATQDLINTLPIKHDKVLAKEKSMAIAKLASAEWAKDDCCRVINTRHINIWGNSILRSITEKGQLPTLDRILNDAQGLLAGNIHPEDIHASRYFPQQPFSADLDLDF